METLQRAPHERPEADVDYTIRALFARCPALCRFTVRDRASLPDQIDPTTLHGDIFIFEVSLWPRYGQSQYEEIYGQIAAALDAVIRAEPEQKKLLPGRSFVRALH